MSLLLKIVWLLACAAAWADAFNVYLKVNEVIWKAGSQYAIEVMCTQDGNRFNNSAAGGGFTISFVDNTERQLAIIGSGTFPSSINSSLVSTNVSVTVPGDLATNTYKLRLCLTADNCRSNTESPFVVPVSGHSSNNPINPNNPDSLITNTPAPPSTGSIIGISVAGVAFLCLLGGGGFYFWRSCGASSKKKHARRSQDSSMAFVAADI